MTMFKSAIRACGLSQDAAAQYLSVSRGTISHWASGRDEVPAGVWNELADLYERIQDAADFAADHMSENGIDPRAFMNLDADDGADPLPDGAARAAGAMALLMAIRDGGGT